MATTQLLLIADRPESGFDLFWRIYPRKVAKEAAKRMWRKALKLAGEPEIIAGATRYARERAGQDASYTKHPATWLNGGCWTDEAAPQRCAPPSSNGHAANLLRRMRERQQQEGNDYGPDARFEDDERALPAPRD